jgi:mRNA interferase MazF
MVAEPRRSDVWLVALDPTRGSEIRKTRPCVVISPDEMNLHLRTTIVAPMSTGARHSPMRVSVRFQGKEGEIVLDQIRTVDKSRLIRHLGRLPAPTGRRVSAVLLEMFSWG